MSGGGLQPYRKNGPLRGPGQVLDAMLRGADLGGRNPADAQRAQQELGGDGRRQRPARPPRRERPPRPAR